MAQGGYALQFTGSIAAIWPPVGLAVAVLYLFGLRWWPGAVLGDLLSAGGGPTLTVVAVHVSNLAEVVTATILLRRLIGREAKLDRLEQIGGMLLAIAPAVAITATVATLSLWSDGVIHERQLGSIWRTLWLGDSSGLLVLLPLIIVWINARRTGWSAARTAEAVALLAAVVGVSLLAVSTNRPLAYLVFPALIWAALRFGQLGAMLAATCAAGMAVWQTAHDVGPFVTHSISESALSTQLYIAVSTLTALCLGAIMSERERAAAALVESQRREVERAAEERQRIARDLHDSVSQSLFSMTLHARTAQRALAQASDPDGAVGGELEQVADLSRTALAEMRALIFELRPGGLAEEGLVAALSKHASAVAAREKLSITVTGPGGRLPLEPDPEEHLYRLAQEALSNAVRHSGASRITIEVTCDDGFVRLAVGDDGRGFDPGRPFPGHLGLGTMRDRAAEIGGTIRIDSASGRGTTVHVKVRADRNGAAQ